jgi:hypothetical protein
MKRSEEIGKHIFASTLDMVGVVKELRLPTRAVHASSSTMTAEEQAEEMMQFAQTMYKLSNACQDIAWASHQLRDAIIHEQWDSLLATANELGAE